MKSAFVALAMCCFSSACSAQWYENAVIYEIYPRSFQDSTATIQDLAKVYGSNHDEIQLPMDFLYGNLKTLDAAVFKKQVDAAQLELGGQTPVFFFSSHDHPRQWSTFGDGTNNDQIAKLTAALTLTQRGCALMYYGEELGMGTMTPQELKPVPTGPKRPRADDRDGERTPMQWTTGLNGGFSKGTPWLPVEASYRRYSVAREKKDANSIYKWYAKLLKLRHDNAALRDGSYVPLESGNDKVFAFGRMAAGQSHALVVLNMSSQEQTVSISGMPGGWESFGKVILASPLAVAPVERQFTIAAYGVLISGDE